MTECAAVSELFATCLRGKHFPSRRTQRGDIWEFRPTRRKVNWPVKTRWEKRRATHTTNSTRAKKRPIRPTYDRQYDRLAKKKHRRGLRGIQFSRRGQFPREGFACIQIWNGDTSWGLLATCLDWNTNVPPYTENPYARMIAQHRSITWPQKV